jgi:antitoxin component of RelBE/YafQ-DinJ toxin-antitoxin module
VVTATLSGIPVATKRAAAANAKAAGSDLPTLVRGFVSQLAREPEAAQEYRRPNAVTLKAIRDAEQGIGLTRFTSIEELRKAVGWD